MAKKNQRPKKPVSDPIAKTKSRPQIRLEDFAVRAANIQDTDGQTDLLTVDFIPEAEEHPDLISIWDIAQEDWMQIHLLAVQIRNAGHWGGHFEKCYVSGFIRWLEYNNKAIIFDEPPMMEKN